VSPAASAVPVTRSANVAQRRLRSPYEGQQAQHAGALVEGECSVGLLGQAVTDHRHIPAPGDGIRTTPGLVVHVPVGQTRVGRLHALDLCEENRPVRGATTAMTGRATGVSPR
jgi:hypothetical protein